MDPEAVRKEVDALRRGWAGAPEVIVVSTLDDPQVPHEARADNAGAKAQGAQGEPEGLYYEGRVYLVASKLSTPHDVARVLFHEVLGHHGLQGVFGDELQSILAQISAVRRGPVTLKAVQYGMDPTNQADRLRAAEEVLAEMAQNTPELGFVKRAIAAIRTWLRAHVPALRGLRMTDDEIIRNFILPARRFVERGGPGGGPRGGLPALSLGESAGEAALRELASADDLFALPKSDKMTVKEITADTDAQIKVREVKLPGNETMYTLTMPDGSLARLTVRKSGPTSVYGANEADEGGYDWITGRPGENPEAVPDDATDVWIDVSNLKPGQNGARVYNIAATYAHNNGYIFIGDPSGLSDAAMRRRAEQMLSSALKFGTTAHLAPHPRQVEGGAGVPPLRWIYGDHVGNIERLIDLNLRALDNAFPQAAATVSYDPDSGLFLDARTGKRVDRATIRAAVERLAVRGAAPDAGVAARARQEAGAGWRTVARGAVLRSLLGRGRARGDGAGRAAGGGSVLEGLVRQRDQLGAAARQDRIFYSRSSAAATDGLTEGRDEAAAIAKKLSEAGRRILADAERAHAAALEQADKAHEKRAKADGAWLKKERERIQEAYELEADAKARNVALSVLRTNEAYRARVNDEMRAKARAEAQQRLDMARASAEGAPSPWESTAPTWADRLIYEAQDGRIDLKRTQEAIEAAGNKIDERFDARLAETLYAGRVAKRTQTFLEREVRPLMRVMARLRVSQTELGDYLHARAAPERNAQIAKVNPDMPDGGAGANSQGLLLTTAAARKYIADIEPARRAQLEDLAKKVDAITKGTRQVLVNEGLRRPRPSRPGRRPTRPTCPCSVRMWSSTASPCTSARRAARSRPSTSWLTSSCSARPR